MISVVVDKKNYSNEIIISDKKDINHLINVFRLVKGDKIRVVDSEFEYICKIDSVEKEKIILSILEKNTDAFSLNINLDAAISLLKNEKMDLCIQKLAELGINNFIPMQAKRCVSKLDRKKDKWDKIVNETLKQCQAVNPMKISEVIDLKKIDYDFYDLIIVPYECEDICYIKNIITEKEKIKNILYLIGPEGGFDKEEIEFLKEKKAKIVSLGKRILRAETAAIVTGGVIINEFQ